MTGWLVNRPGWLDGLNLVPSCGALEHVIRRHQLLDLWNQIRDLEWLGNEVIL